MHLRPNKDVGFSRANSKFHTTKAVRKLRSARKIPTSDKHHQFSDVHRDEISSCTETHIVLGCCLLCTKWENDITAKSAVSQA